MSQPLGSILVTSDAQDAVIGDAVVLDPNTGAVLSSFPFVYSALGNRLPNGLIALTVETSSSDSTLVALNIYTASLTLLASVTSIAIPSWDAFTSPVAASDTNFYPSVGTGPSLTTSPTVYQVSQAGVVSSTHWVLPANAHGSGVSFAVMGVTGDDATLYYGTSVVPGVLHSYHLGSSSAGPDIVTLGTNETFGIGLIVLPSGNLVFLVGNTSTGAWAVRQYTSGGSLVNSISLGTAGAFSAPELFWDIAQSQVWVRAFADATGHTSTMTLYNIATGAVVPPSPFPITNLDGGGPVPATCPTLTLGPQSPSPNPTPAMVGTRQTVPIKWVRRTSQMSDELLWLFFSEFQLMFQPGVGQANDPGANPQIGLRWSNDGGNTWSNQRWVSAGLQGQYGTRAIWRMLGRARNRVWELTSTDPVVWAIVDAFAVVEKQA